MNRRLRSLWPLLLCLPVLYGFDPFSTSNGNVEQGNARLKAGKIKEALQLYDRAAKELPDEAGVHYNRGIALHRLGKYKKAREALLKGTAALDPGLKARAFYNLGNAHFKLKGYKDAVAAYMRALQLTPGHRPSKWNLELALRKIQEKKKKDKKNKKNKKKKKKDKKNKKNNKKKKDDPGNKKNKDRKKKKDKSQPKDDPKKRKDKKRMNSVLDALDRKDKNLQKRRARVKGGRRRKPEKDW